MPHNIQTSLGVNSAACNKRLFVTFVMIITLAQVQLFSVVNQTSLSTMVS